VLKTVITAVLTVTSGLDPHMINLLEVDIKSFSLVISYGLAEYQP
jgi:hypothetical protein